MKRSHRTHSRRELAKPWFVGSCITVQVFRSYHIGSQWERFPEQLSVRDWLNKIIDAIDAILDSPIDEVGGTSGLIKEFKDALETLA